MADESSWAGHVIDAQSGLFVPAPLAKARAAASERADQVARGKFFSQMGRAERYNQAGAQEKPPDEPSFMYLRNAYWESQIDQIIVARRQQQVRGVARRVQDAHDHRVGWTVQHRRAHDPHFHETAAIRDRGRALGDLLEHATPEVHPAGLADVLTTATEEELVLDRKVCVLFRDRRGLPAQYHMIDGATVKPIVRVLYHWIEEHAGEQDTWGPDMWDVAAEALSTETGLDMTRAAWVQEVDGVIVAAWGPHDLHVEQLYPSVEINRLAYGRGSLFQRSLTLTDLWISLVDYNRGLFAVDYPENALFVYGDYSPAGLEAFTRQLSSQVGSRNWSRLAVIPADPEFKADVKPLRNTPKDMLWPNLWQHIVSLKTAVYSMHPSEINQADSGNAAPALNAPNEETQIAYAKEEGFDALIHQHADWLTRMLIRPHDPAYEMVWVNLHRETEQARIQLTSQRVGTYLTINEARQADDLDPLAAAWADMPLPLAQIAMQQQSGGAGASEGAASPDVGAPRPSGAPPPAKPAEARRPGEAKGGHLARGWVPRTTAIATGADGAWHGRLGGRVYVVQDTPYGTRVYADHGAPVVATSERFDTPEAAFAWLGAWRVGQEEGETP